MIVNFINYFLHFFMKSMKLIFNGIINYLFSIIDGGFLIINFLISIGGEVSYKGLKISFEPSSINIYIQ